MKSGECVCSTLAPTSRHLHACMHLRRQYYICRQTSSYIVLQRWWLFELWYGRPECNAIYHRAHHAMAIGAAGCPPVYTRCKFHMGTYGGHFRFLTSPVGTAYRTDAVCFNKNVIFMPLCLSFANRQLRIPFSSLSHLVIDSPHISTCRPSRSGSGSGTLVSVDRAVLLLLQCCLWMKILSRYVCDHMNIGGPFFSSSICKNNKKKAQLFCVCMPLLSCCCCCFLFFIHFASLHLRFAVPHPCRRRVSESFVVHTQIVHRMFINNNERAHRRAGPECVQSRGDFPLSWTEAQRR